MLTAFILFLGLKGSWKAPIAYFLTRTLNAATLAQLVQHSLLTLHEQGLRVHCITMDGHQSNIAMARILGAQTNVGQHRVPFIQLPGQGHRIFILFDPCHMLKLVRNMLHDIGAFQSDDGVVRWCYIAALDDLQSALGLRLANKLSPSHIRYQDNKMKVNEIFNIVCCFFILMHQQVRLATQVLSSSVADAITFLEEKGVPHFHDTSPTVEFIKVCIYMYICVCVISYSPPLYTS